MNKAPVFYITEEEKRYVLNRRMEEERKANRKRLSAYEMQHRIAGIMLLVLGTIAYFGMESIVICIMCGLFGLIGLLAREEDREEWVDR